MLKRTSDSVVIYSAYITDTHVTISDLDAITVYSLVVTAINDQGFRSKISNAKKYATKELGMKIEKPYTFIHTKFQTIDAVYVVCNV